MYNYLKQEKTAYSETYELNSILRKLKTNTTAEENKPTLKDELNTLSQVNGLLTNPVDRIK